MEKILFFCMFPPPYNGQSLATKLAYELLSEKYNLQKINISNSQLIKRNIFINGLLTFKNYFQLIKMLSINNYKSIYIVPGSSLLGNFRDFFVVMICKLFKVKIVAHVHNGNYLDNFKNNFLICNFFNYLRFIDHFIFLSNILAKDAKSFIPLNKINIIYNSIEKNIQANEFEIKQKLFNKRKRSVFNIVFLSNMIKSKGYIDVAYAISMLDNKEIQYKADFIGTWDNKKQKLQFISLLKKLSIFHIISIHGNISDRKIIKQILLDADAFILPTYYPKEAQPLSIIEALNTATPIITTAHAGIPDIVKNDVNGYIVPKESPVEIFKCIEKLIDYNTWKSKSMKAREDYLLLFSYNIHKRKLLNLFS